MLSKISSSSFEVSVGVGQGSALSPILLALYLSLFLYILEKCLKNLNIPVSLIFLWMVDSLFLRTNQSTLQILNFSVAIMY